MPPAKPVKSIYSLLEPYRLLVGMLVVFAILANAANLAIPEITARAIDSFSRGHFSYGTVIISFAVAAGVIFLFTALQSIVQVIASERVARDTRNQMAAKISEHEYAWIQSTNPSKLLTNLTSDIDSVKMYIAVAIPSIVSSVVILIGASVLLLVTNWKLGLAVLATLPVIAITFGFILSKVRVLFVKSREVIDWLNKIINESILGAALIRVVNAQMPEYNKFLDANTNARDVGMDILKLFSALIPIITFVANMGTLIILLLGGHLVISGSMTLGDFAAFQSYVALLIFPILIIGFMSGIIAQATASYNRISQVLDSEIERIRGSVKKTLDGQVSVADLSITYGERKALDSISFDIAPGTKTAIIGPTAAGKTQLLYALTGLVKPDSGRISYDDVTLSDLAPSSIQNQIGLVFQDSVMFNLTLRENIAFSNTVTDESLQLAIDTAELNDFIHALPDGLNTVASERGTSLSGGQKQRIMLARALALDPKILYLDDFTARVDQKTEQSILGNLSKNYPHLTLVSVTQKISSIESYDKIIVMMEGEKLAEGTHDELLKSSPEYMQLYNSQRSTEHYEQA